MEKNEIQLSRKRLHHLRVSVFENEKDQIEVLACQSGLSVARYLRNVGQGTR
jgi:hypothetical protein